LDERKENIFDDWYETVFDKPQNSINREKIDQAKKRMNEAFNRAVGIGGNE
jgi:hypothetical protein